MDQLTPADMRRAGALIAHFGRPSQEGVDAVLAETTEEGRALPLLFAVLTVYDELVPELRSDMGMQLMTSSILKLAQMEGPS